jgi:hypothetical protein
MPGKPVNKVGRRLITWAFWLAPVAALVALLGDWFDPPYMKIGGATRKCGFAMEINMIKDAESYCKTAIEIANGPYKIPSMDLARAYTQAAALAIHELRVDEAVALCGKAVPEWKQVGGRYHEKEKAESINACETLIAAAKDRKKAIHPALSERFPRPSRWARADYERESATSKKTF